MCTTRFSGCLSCMHARLATHALLAMHASLSRIPTLCTPPATHAPCNSCPPCHACPPMPHMPPCHAHAPPTTHAPPHRQNDWHTLLKILSCPRLRLRAVKFNLDVQPPTHFPTELLSIKRLNNVSTFLGKIDTRGLGTSAAVGIALACLVLLVLLVLNAVFCYRKKRQQQREARAANQNQHYIASDVSTIWYGDDSSQRPLQGSSRNTTPR